MCCCFRFIIIMIIIITIIIIIIIIIIITIIIIIMSLSANIIMAKLTNHVQRTRFITSSTDKHYSLDSEDYFRSGCQN